MNIYDAHAAAVRICATAAEGLDLSVHDDRVAFRACLADATRNTKVTAIAKCARALGEWAPANNRAKAVRALARGWGG